MRVIIRLLLSLALMAFAAGCGAKNGSPPTTTSSQTSSQNAFDNYLDADFTPAEGFDFPFGDPDGKGSYADKATGKTHDGWYVATRSTEKYSLGIHTGEDWNGNGGGNTDLGQDVFSVANGRVVFAESCGRLWGNVVIIEHVFYENHERRKIRSLYAHLQTIKVRRGDEVKKRQPIATIGQDPDKTFNAHLHSANIGANSMGLTALTTAGIGSRSITRTAMTRRAEGPRDTSRLGRKRLFRQAGRSGPRLWKIRGSAAESGFTGGRRNGEMTGRVISPGAALFSTFLTSRKFLIKFRRAQWWLFSDFS
jgi:Peptidase family M23